MTALPTPAAKCCGWRPVFEPRGTGHAVRFVCNPERSDYRAAGVSLNALLKGMRQYQTERWLRSKYRELMADDGD